MIIDKNFRLYVVSVDGITRMSLQDYALAVQGGLSPDIAIFTTNEEAEAHLRQTKALRRATEVLELLPTDVIEQITESLEREGGRLPLLIKMGKEQSVIETMKKCGV